MCVCVCVGATVLFLHLLAIDLFKWLVYMTVPVGVCICECEGGRVCVLCLKRISLTFIIIKKYINCALLHSCDARNNIYVTFVVFGCQMNFHTRTVKLHCTERRTQTNNYKYVYLALWTRKVLCGICLCAIIYKFSFIRNKTKTTTFPRTVEDEWCLLDLSAINGRSYFQLPQAERVHARWIID